MTERTSSVNQQNERLTRAAEDVNSLKSEMKTAVTVAGLVNSVPEMAMLSKVLVPSSPSPAMLQLPVREELRVALENDITKVIDQSELNAMTAASETARRLQRQKSMGTMAHQLQGGPRFAAIASSIEKFCVDGLVVSKHGNFANGVESAVADVNAFLTAYAEGNLQSHIAR